MWTFRFKWLKVGVPCVPNLKTTKQGKNVKLALQHGHGLVWDNLHDNSVWLDLNVELRDVTYPPPKARVQECQFMEPTLETLMASPTPTTNFRAQGKPVVQLPPRQQIAPPMPPNFVDLEDDGNDEPEAAPALQKKCIYAQNADGHRVFH